MKASFVYIPPKGGKSHTLQAAPWVLKAVAVLLVLLVIFVLVSAYLTTSLTSEIAHYRAMRDRAVAHERVLKENTQQFQQLQDNIELLLDSELEIRNLLNKPEQRESAEELAESKKKRLIEFRKKLDASSTHPQKLTDFLVSNVGMLQQDMSKHTLKLQAYQKRFAATPSIWPVYGNIRSGFGSRLHPILGRHIFHKGIDIPSWIGAPVKSTADGVIEYSGWSGPYGNVVIVDHNYGYRTIYAHLSKLLARQGERVKKGQPIGQVGSTGLSTGPHLHYEVMRWRQSVPPTTYLELDMFTAADRMW